MAKLCDNCRRSKRVWCPHNAALEISVKLKGKLKKDMFGETPPNFFVGHNFYPNVYAGPLISSEKTVDDPTKMYGMSLQEIIENRALVVRGMKRSYVKIVGRDLEEAQLSVMSIKPTDAEAKFSKEPVFNFEFDDISHPIGASAPIERFRLTENAPVPKKVDELYNDSVLANEAISELLILGFDVHYISKLLTAGIFGKKKARKLVPTKWAITATDDIAAKRFMESIREYREIEEISVYSNTYLDNRFVILLLPGSWEYEQFETALSEGNISEEYEPFSGRKDYAERQGGGYYAARYSVCEALYKMKRQAIAIVFREIGPEYTIGVGVWEVRETVRHAFLNPPEKFETTNEALLRLSQKLSVPFGEYMKRSRILLQKRLTEF